MATQTGYKESELGMIPQDWDIVEFEEICQIRKQKVNPLFQSGEFCVELEHLEPETGLLLGNTVTKPNSSIKTVFQNGDVLFGKLRAYLRKYWLANQDGVCSTEIWAFVATNKAINPFLFYVVQTEQFIKAASEAYGTHMPRSDWNVVKNYLLPLPPLPEQTAIATALSDTDALISSLQKLIAKKKAIKLSAMQNLLNGEIRLPEFAQRTDGSLKTTRQTELGCVPEDWEMVELEKVAEIKSGGTPSTNRSEFWNGHILWCTPTDITSLSGKYLSDTNRKITEMGLNNSAAELLPIGSVLMTSRATIGECAIVKRPMTTNQGFKNFICNRTVNNEFLYYLLSSQKDKFIELCNGSTFLEISTTQVRKFKITIPKSTTEQTAIAQLLSDMDAEIESLECRLKKTQALKQGMMQTLLTGKIRLPLE